MQRKQALYLVAILALLVAMLPSAAIAQQSAPPEAQTGPLNIEVLTVNQEGEDASLSGKAAQPGSLLDGMAAPDGMNLFSEIEPNGTAATATALPSNDIVAVGNVFPNGDLDYFSFTGNAGDRVYAATMTSFSASGSTDSVLTLYNTDGTTVIEDDNDNGSFSSTSSSIAGATLPANGTYYLQVRHNSATSQLRPYRLHLKVQSGSPTPETEPNSVSPGQPLPPSGWVSGALTATTDIDIFAVTLNAGDTVYLSLDLDPERDNVEWNAQLGLAVFNNFILVVNDAGATGPDSEAFFMTVKDAGTYYVYVMTPTGGTTFGTYNLSVSVLPKAQQANCTTYTSTDVPVVIPTGPGMAQSTLTVPGNPRIADIDVSIVLTHTFMQDLDAHLVSPAGNDNGLFTDVGNSTVGSPNIQMNTTLDDEAGIPIGQFTVVSGPSFTPELAYRLSWYDYTDAGGVWTLKLYDDATGDGGVLQSWSVTICEPPPPPSCPVGYEPVTVYSSDFEADNGGFTTSGTAVDWARGTPTAAPINTCNGGVNCWKTNLNGDYSPSSNQNLTSPAINLAGYSGPVILRWAQKYQMESASFDGAFAQVQEVGGANPTRLWTWLDATMRNSLGNPSTTIQESAGWGERWADISSYAGQSIETVFNLSSDSTVQLAGLGIDDVSVTACQEVPSNPAISLDKTVGTDPSVCATTDEITLPYGGGEVTYCYEVTNTGDVSFNTHDLDDSELGALLNNFPYSLAPGASAFLTATSYIDFTTVNTATWTAYNQFDGGPVQATASDLATVTVDLPAPAIVLTKTVGLDPNACATTDEITVAPNTDVTYCYEVENTGNVEFNFHDLTDSELGALLTDYYYNLAPGATVFVTETANIAVTTVNTASWYAESIPPKEGFPSAQATDVATVTVAALNPAIVLTKTVGLDPNACATTDDITVPANTDVTYCYTVENTGDVTFNLHDLDDSELGSILNGLPYALAPGASVFVTATTPIAVTTVNTGTWTAYNSGAVEVCSTPNVAIPDNNPAGVSDTLDSVTSGAISDLDVYINTTHTWVGDLIYTLQHADTATTVTLIDRPGRTTTGFGCSGDNINNTVDDEAALSFENNCANANPAYVVGDGYRGGDPASSTVLAAFDGEDLSGDWTLTVSDNAGGDTGTLNEWCLVTAGSGESVSASDTATVTVEIDPPNIFVDPLSMASTQAPDVQVQQTLTISNTGGGTLNWTIDEEPASVLAAIDGDLLRKLQSASASVEAPLAGADGSRGGSAGGAAPIVYDSPADFSEDFADITLLPGQGWFFQNNSSPLGLTDWFQGNDTVFPAHAGAPTAYIGANFNNTSGVGTISNWMLTPVLNLNNGDTISFWTSTAAGSIWPDRLELRLSTAGASTNVGTLATDVGDFTTLLLSVNPSLAAGGYPETWTQYTATLSGLSGGETGRIAFRYFVTNAGPSGDNSNYIGIDTVEYTSAGQPQVCTSPANVPWLSEVPANGANAGGTATDVTVTFDSTGLAAGVYNANLCVSSNDPDPGPGNETDLVIVPVTLTVEAPPIPPNIFVDPLSMASSQAANTQVQQTLTISNTGGGTLDWVIDEEDTTLPPFVTASSAPDLASASEDASTVAAPGAPEAAPANVSIWRSPDVVLYDNGPLVNSAGTGVGGADESVLQNTTLAMTTLGFGHQVLNNNWVADDFTVGDPGGWTVDTATFFAYQTGSTTTSTMTNVNWILYDGQPGSGGSVITSGSGLASTAWANIYRVTQTTTGSATDRPIMATTVNLGGLALPAGTYWLAWQTAGTLASGPWAPPITINGQTTTGNGLQSLAGTAAWAAANDGGTLTQQGFPFILEGTVGGTAEPCTALSDIAWLSLAPTNGSNAGGTDTDVTVTFDSTGLVPGVYTGNLCVTSNDPDAGPGNETDLVIVPVTLTVLPPTAVALTDLAADAAQSPAPLAGLPLAALPAAVAAALGAAFVWRRQRD